MRACKAPFLFPPDTKAPRFVPNHARDRVLRDIKVARFRLYDLRSTRATGAAESGIGLVTLATPWAIDGAALVHATQEHQRRAVERLELFVAIQQVQNLDKRSDAVDGDALQKHQGRYHYNLAAASPTDSLAMESSNLELAYRKPWT